ncbi:MAG: hypothetical protein HYR51_11530 [Candidatus Rokubacteria bacterium]|nr:hypothetical protein [Candidatus Rokubacteria bacterium]
MDRGLQQLQSIDGRRIAGYLAGRNEFHRAFPLFFRVVGDEVVSRLAPALPGIAAHVGEDYRREAIDRWQSLLPPLDWVAFSFPGYSMWDLHVGVVARLDVWPALCQAGVHWTAAVAGVIEPLVRSVDWPAVTGAPGELADSPNVGEIQQRDHQRPLDPIDLAGEASRFIERAIRYYAAMRKVLDARR